MNATKRRKKKRKKSEQINGRIRRNIRAIKVRKFKLGKKIWRSAKFSLLVSYRMTDDQMIQTRKYSYSRVIW